MRPSCIDSVPAGSRAAPSREWHTLDAQRQDPGRAYECAVTRVMRRWLGSCPKGARRGEEYVNGVSCVRGAVERTISWFKGMRWTRIRFDRLLAIQHARNAPAATAACFRLATQVQGVKKDSAVRASWTLVRACPRRDGRIAISLVRRSSLQSRERVRFRRALPYGIAARPSAATMASTRPAMV